MATLTAAKTTKGRSCSMCPDHPAPELESNRLSWVTSCERHEVPIVALKRHTGSPTAGEWRRLETRAKRSFPEFRWQRPVSFNGHFYLHAVGLGMRCNLEHAVAA